MEVIRAIVMIFLGLLFLSFIIKITYPILILFALYILYLIIKNTYLNRKYQSQYTSNQNTYQNSSTNQSSSTRSNDSDIIDVEYTESDLD